MDEENCTSVNSPHEKPYDIYWLYDRLNKLKKYFFLIFLKLYFGLVDNTCRYFMIMLISRHKIMFKINYEKCL